MRGRYINPIPLPFRPQTLQLTKAEKLQLINSRPTSLVELHLMLEDCESRFEEEVCHQLLGCIEEYL